MKKTKLLVLSGVAMLLAACGETSNASGAFAKINIWAPAEEQSTIKAVVDEWNKTASADQKIEYVFTAVQEGDAGNTLATDPKVKNYPSLVAIADDQLNVLVTKKIVNALPATYANAIKANDESTAVLGATNGDKIYAFPITQDNGYFRWYDSTKISDSEVGSLETILSKASSSKQFLMALDNGWYANSIFHAQGVCGVESLSYTTAADGKTSYNITWDSAEAVAAADAMSKLVGPKYAANAFISGGNDNITAGFTDGTLMAAVSGTWMESHIDTALGEAAKNIKAVKLPTFKVNGVDHQLGSFFGSKLYVTNAYATVAEQRTALKLADLLTTKSAQITRFEKRKCVPCNKEAAADPKVSGNVTKGQKALAAQNAFAAVQSKSAEGRYWPVGEAIGKAIMKNELPEGKTWSTFLKEQCDILRKAA